MNLTANAGRSSESSSTTPSHRRRIAAPTLDPSHWCRVRGGSGCHLRRLIDGSESKNRRERGHGVGGSREVAGGPRRPTGGRASGVPSESGRRRVRHRRHAEFAGSAVWPPRSRSLRAREAASGVGSARGAQSADACRRVARGGQFTVKQRPHVHRHRRTTPPRVRCSRGRTGATTRIDLQVGHRLQVAPRISDADALRRRQGDARALRLCEHHSETRTIQRGRFVGEVRPPVDVAGFPEREPVPVVRGARGK
jgi:hypothetical protein